LHGGVAAVDVSGIHGLARSEQIVSFHPCTHVQIEATLHKIAAQASTNVAQLCDGCWIDESTVRRAMLKETRHSTFVPSQHGFNSDSICHQIHFD